MSKQHSSKNHAPSKTEGTLFGLKVSRRFKPILVVSVVLLALGGTYWVSHQRSRSAENRFASGQAWTPPADTPLEQTGNPDSSTPGAEASASGELESNTFQPGTANYYLTEAITLFHQEKYNEALAKLLLAQEKSPENEDIYFNLGATLAKLGRIPEAMSAYERALEILPNYAEVHNNLGRIYLTQNELDKASTHFQKALEVTPRNATAHNNYGIILARQKDYQNAESHFLEAVELNPDYAEAYVNLAYLYITSPLLPAEEDRVSRAREQFNNALRVNPDFEQARKGLASLDSVQAPPLLARPPETN